jgi:hypothetical protein
MGACTDLRHTLYTDHQEGCSAAGEVAPPPALSRGTFAALPVTLALSQHRRLVVSPTTAAGSTTVIRHAAPPQHRRRRLRFAAAATSQGSIAAAA